MHVEGVEARLRASHGSSPRASSRPARAGSPAAGRVTRHHGRAQRRPGTHRTSGCQCSPGSSTRPRMPGMFGVGRRPDGRVQAGDAPAGVVPLRLVQRPASGAAEHVPGVAPDLDHAACIGSCRPRARGRSTDRACAAWPCTSSRCGPTHLQHHAPSSSLKKRASASARCRRSHRPGVAQFLESPYSARLSADAVAFGDEHVDVQARRPGSVPRKSHLAHRRPTGHRRCDHGKRAGLPWAARTFVHGRRPVPSSLRRLVQIGHDAPPNCAQHLREDRAAHALPTGRHRGRRGSARCRCRPGSSCGVSVPRTSSSAAKAETHDQRHRGRRRCLSTGPSPPSSCQLRAHRQRILAHRHADTERRAKLHAPPCPHGVVQRRVFARLAAGRHPVGSSASRAPAFDRRGQEVGDGLAHGHAPRGGGVHRRDRRAFAHAHRLAGESRRSLASVTAQSATGTCQGPTIGSRWFRPPTVRSPIVTRKRLRAHGRMAQHVEAPRASSVTPFDRSSARSWIALHARARRACMRGALPSSTSTSACRSRARSALALPRRPASARLGGHCRRRHAGSARAAHICSNSGSSVRIQRQHVALLALVAPDFLGRQPALFQRHLRAGRRPRPCPAPSTSSGKALLMPPAPTSWIARTGFFAPSAQQWLMTSCARRWISGLPRCTLSKSSCCSVGAGGHRAGGTAAHADAHAGPARAAPAACPAPKGSLWVWLSLIAPMPPAIMMGLW